MDNPWLTVAWFLTVFLFFVSAFFSGSETAIMAVNRLRLRRLADGGDQGARRVAKLLEDPTRLLSGILLGNNFANTTLASLATALAEPVWGEMAPVVVAPILTILLLIFAEIFPKSLASHRSMSIARFTSAPLALFLRIAEPISRVTSFAARLLLKPFVNEQQEDEGAVAAEDLISFAVLGREQGAIGDVTHELLHGLYEFTRSTVVDVMIPRHEMVAMPLDGGLETFEELVRRHRHTRIPVWGENEEDILGVLHAKDLLLHRAEMADGPLDRFLHPAQFVN